MRYVLLGLLLLSLAAGAGFAIAQENEKSRFTRWVERQISTPDRRISLGTIEGALSSNVRISEITVADREGVWLRIEEAELVWSRLALLRGRLSIDRLEASAIRVLRSPLPVENDEPLEEGSEFQLPDLPVSVRIDRLAVPQVEIAEGVIGPASSLSVSGSVRLAGGELDTSLVIDRLDRPGELSLSASFDDETRRLAVDLSLSEPGDGVLANALDIEGRPPLDFTVEGEGPLSDFQADIALAAAGETLLSGVTRITGTDGGLRFLADIEGDLTPLVPDLYEPLVAGGSTLSLDMVRRGDGSFVVDEGRLESGVASLTFSAALAPDGVPTSLAVDGRLERPDRAPVALPGGGGRATIRSAVIDVSLGEGTFQAQVSLTELDSPLITAPSAQLTGSGTTESLADPQARALTFTVSGRASGLTSGAPGVADALGSALTLDVDGAWQAGEPVTFDTARLETDTLTAAFEGTLGNRLDGTYRLDTANLAAFASLAGRDLAGAVDLAASGTIGFSGLFDLSVDGRAVGLETGVDPLDGLLKDETTLSGGVARRQGGISFDDFRLDNPAIALRADGALDDTRADLDVEAELADLSALAQRAQGAVAASLAISGDPARPRVAVRIDGDRIVLAGRPVTDLSASFDGVLDPATDGLAADGSLSVEANYAGEPLSVAARLSTGPEVLALEELSARVADARASGSLALLEDRLLRGDVALEVPEIARVAPLALAEASGSLDGDVSFSVSDGLQNAAINAEARDLQAAGVSVGFAAIDLTVEDAFGVPALDGRADLRALRAAGFDVRSARLVANRSAQTTSLSLAADIGAGRLETDGSLTRVPGGFSAAINRFLLERDGQSASLVSPTEVSLADGTVSIGDTELSVGAGRIGLSGTLGDRLDLSARLDALPLSVANTIRPELDVSGTVSGDLALAGTAENPTAEASLTADGVTAAPLRERGIDPLDLALRGRFADGTATVERFATSVGGGTVTAFGTVGRTLDLAVSVKALPLALANVIVPELALSGSVSASADLSGSLREPVAAVEAEVTNATGTPIRRAGLEPLDVTLAGRYADGTAQVERLEAALGGGRVTAEGTIGRRLDVTAMLRKVPLSLVDAVRPELGVRGALSGTVRATGPIARPAVSFDVESPEVSAAPLRNAGLPPAAVSAEGTYDRRTVTLREGIVRVAGGSIRAQGAVGRRIDLSAGISELPLSLADAFRPSLALSGRLSGELEASGSLAAPSARFDLSASGVSAAPLRDAGIPSVTATARGRFARGAVRLERADVQGAGLSAAADGTVPLSGRGLDLSVSAAIPLSLADRFLAERGATLDGEGRADLTVRGSLADPSVNGRVSGEGIVLRDPLSSLVLEDGRLSARLSGDRAVIEELTATLGGGTVSVDGSLGIGSGFPADLTVALRGARYTDGRLFSITLDGDLAVTGPLTGSPLVAGEVRVDRAEFNVPAGLGGSATLIDVRYVDPSYDVLQTLRRARAGPFAEPEERGERATGLRLDVSVSAPRRIFVRGRGVDAEFGGEVTLTGPVSDIRPVGAFEMIRGRIVILGQRIVFTEGEVTLLGELDPQIRLVAETQANQVTVRVIVTGSVRDPEIRFESEPELPQDEVLAQLLFRQSLSELSPFQLARLAAAAAELAGGGEGPGVLEQFRAAAGLDNLEIITTEEGGTAAEAGRYISDNVYFGVRAGAESGVTVNLDITRGLKLRAEALTDETTLGIYYETEY